MCEDPLSRDKNSGMAEPPVWAQYQGTCHISNAPILEMRLATINFISLRRKMIYDLRQHDFYLE
jgi:hypothetical protein